ncbi:hypothetical protein LWI28_024114 [Acer negundo]|uniref:Uncharacterized protein n=1 Tax=Acer negundo TaxID=4023 RepID=A0AAD5JNI8_ACENE|nr:hypothetical protein LWI28_024114 [Acer negundo]
MGFDGGVGGGSFDDDVAGGSSFDSCVFVFVLVFAAGAVKALPSGFLFGSSSDPRPHLRFVVPSDADDAS